MQPKCQECQKNFDEDDPKRKRAWSGGIFTFRCRGCWLILQHHARVDAKERHKWQMIKKETNGAPPKG